MRAVIAALILLFPVAAIGQEEAHKEPKKCEMVCKYDKDGKPYGCHCR